MSKEYWRGYHACELAEPFNEDATEEWKAGYMAALNTGAYKPQ